MATNGARYYSPTGARTDYKLQVRVGNGPLQDAQIVRWNGTQLVDPSGSVVTIPGGSTPTTPATALTRFGACPEPSKGSADVVAKYGTKSFLRQFFGSPGAPPAKTAGASGSHFSWSMGITMADQSAGAFSQTVKNQSIATNTAILNRIINGDYDAAYRTALTPLDPNYFRVEILHEIDHKVNGGFYPVALGVAAKNKFESIVRSVNPKLRVVNTLTAYALNPGNSLYTAGTTDSRYGSVRADIIGLDADGVHSFPYPNYKWSGPNAQKWIKDHASSGYSGYSFPEWGTKVTQAGDQPDLLELAKWITFYGDLWKSQPLAPDYACWYDYYNAEKPATDLTRADDQLRMPAPINALKALVAASPAL